MLYPPRPIFTEGHIPNLKSKVLIHQHVSDRHPKPLQSRPPISFQAFIVTGSSSDLGKELTKILYHKNAKVYMAKRSESKAHETITDIQRACPSSSGQLVYLYLDLADLSTIEASADEFLSNEQRFNLLWNNAVS
jgi:retinol dehydrogenase 12